MSNRLQILWKIKQQLQILDLENDYFSVEFQNKNDYLYTCLGALGRSLVIISMFIDDAIGPVAKIDQNTENNSRGQFARLVVQRRKNRQLEGQNRGKDGGATSGSRFDVLSDNHDEDSGILEIGMVMDLVGGANYETTITTKFIRMVEAINKSRISRKGTLKSKGKWILLEKMSKVMVNELKSTNKVGSSIFGPSGNPFDDGYKMGPIILDDSLLSIQFQANSPNLNSKKNMVVKLGNKTRTLNINEAGGYKPTINLNQGAEIAINQQIREVMGDRLGGSSRQDLSKLTRDNPL
ncbi:hypothetical protein J1N35_021631 [Gossypium stocksii]|uniref:Uncharacterized protein n=1 Tax=Gossypium stocksii TaxID=47602 RepID=A0A9D3VEX4_9ROSI|nr:hypothetical protein J1N35_021631 [Gossypium stocksii]